MMTTASRLNASDTDYKNSNAFSSNLAGRFYENTSMAGHKAAKKSKKAEEAGRNKMKARFERRREQGRIEEMEGRLREGERRRREREEREREVTESANVLQGMYLQKKARRRVGRVREEARRMEAATLNIQRLHRGRKGREVYLLALARRRAVAEEKVERRRNKAATRVQAAARRKMNGAAVERRRREIEAFRSGAATVLERRCRSVPRILSTLLTRRSQRVALLHCLTVHHSPLLFFSL